jgi:hypothetical protein
LDRHVLVLSPESVVLGRGVLRELDDAIQEPQGVSVQLSPTAPQSTTGGSIVGVVEDVDSTSGVISGWLSSDIDSIVVVVDNPVDSPRTDVILTGREDVASIHGWRSYYSGFSFTVDPLIHGDVLCVVAMSDGAANTLLWGVPDEC